MAAAPHRGIADTASHALRRVVAALTISATAAGALYADPAWLDETIARLDDESFETREDAAAALIAEPTLTIDEIGERLASADLSAEQRLRLNRVGIERFAKMPRAGLGVRFAAPNGLRGVPLGSVLENFPASAVLRAGDVVLSIDGQRVDSTAQMGALILSRLPGESLRMEIERTAPIEEAPGGIAEVDRLVVDVPLGRYEDLATGVGLTPDRLEAAYRQYQLRRGASFASDRTDTLVGASLAPIEWLRAEGYDHTAPTQQVGKLASISAWRYFSFAGQPRSWNAAIDLRRGDSSIMNRRAMVGLQADGLYDRVEEALAGYRAMLIRVGEIDTQLATLKSGAALIDADRVARIRAERVTMFEGLEELAQELSSEPTPLPGGALGNVPTEAP